MLTRLFLKTASILRNNAVVVLCILLLAEFIRLSFTSVDPVDPVESLIHYLTARYTPAHPMLLLGWWQRPLFTLLSIPFAQFGLAGFKTMNAILAVGTAYICYRIARKLRIDNAFLVFLFIIFSPLFFVSAYSGLEEILFSFTLAVSLYFIVSNRLTVAAIIASFLPLVKHEGLLFLFILACYLFVKREYSRTPLLTIGTLLYSLLLYTFHQNAFGAYINNWNLYRQYGSGSPLFFVSNLPKNLGYMTTLGLCISAVRLTWIYVTHKTRQTERYLLLILTANVSLIGAYSFFLWTGLFGMDPQIRFLIPIIPFSALLSVYGLNAIIRPLGKETVSYVITLGALILTSVLGPRVIFRYRVGSPDWSNNEIAIQHALDWIKKNQIVYTKIYTCTPFVPYALGVDPFDGSTIQHVPALPFTIEPDALFIWDQTCTWEYAIDKQTALTRISAGHVNIFRSDQKTPTGVFNDDVVLVLRGTAQ